MNTLKDSLVERYARDRVKALLDEGSFRELIGPYDGVESPHLADQQIVPQSDDGVVVGKGTLEGVPTVIIAIEGNFQGGGIGEVSGAKIAGALELAIEDNKKGKKTRAVIVFDTGGVRLQEANYGLIAISEIGSAIVELRQYAPVIGIVPGKIGSFGGMSINAGLLSAIIATKEGRIGLNGPEVVELEAGIEEIDSQDRQSIWGMIGGEQRLAMGLVDHLVDDDVDQIKNCLHQIYKDGLSQPRSSQVERYLSLLNSISLEEKVSPLKARELWSESDEVHSGFENDASSQSEQTRGAKWFNLLTKGAESYKRDAESVLCADQDGIRYLCVTAHPEASFYRARNGELGLKEGWMLAKYIREVIEADRNGEKRPIVAIVDVPSQAYGYHEELFGIHQACAASVDAYATARQKGHPIISLVVGKAISGAFLAHGLQANRILALDDEGVNIHVMSKQSAAKITRRTIPELEEATSKVPAMAYDIGSFATLGTLDELIKDVQADQPTNDQVKRIEEKISSTIDLVRMSQHDFSHRLKSDMAVENRVASIKVRKLLKEQW
ncbi:biotin-independent malonate decarboxylase subunit beta [Alkalihalophilus lindianensis]|uniref:Biotin-independent malonate decarboxylase subunit beta n=1 Tax=Alkalihalophilus lindianensis TaxID=1630542 RepID=A0ABU3XEZ1_9BACI|nr:biotin-independent malonate decarboxylase subunit beta [Alkalihalophilus lindianensis]MDV2685964.1 biotin-independent malonate decarboxylase subunit beta [Alkalihalophilus lindianensis]